MLIQSLKEKLQEGKWDNFKSQMKELFQLITEGWGGQGEGMEGRGRAFLRRLKDLFSGGVWGLGGASMGLLLEGIKVQFLWSVDRVNVYVMK